MQIFFNSILRFVFLFFAGCFVSPLIAENVSVVNWNLQTFFDGNTDGCEYSQFKKNDNWNSTAYTVRLTRLCDAIQDMNADIFVFEEIENEGVLYDISNQLAGNIWGTKKNLCHGCFKKNEGDAIGCGVISRFPIEKVTVHNLYVQTENLMQPSMRPIMEVTLNLNNSSKLVLLINHWKSKSSGAEESEVWRNWQETVLCQRFLNNKGRHTLACGDFNRDIYEFEISEICDFNEEKKTNLNLRNSFTKERFSVFSPWIKETGSMVTPGSYYYKNNWERIDHFFASPEIQISYFSPVTDGPWSDGELYIPVRYKIYNGSGYSDHLPIICKISF